MEREVVLTTARMRLTTWVPGDVEDLLSVHSDAETMRFVRDGRPESRAETTALIDQYICEQRGRGWTKWRLADTQDRIVGRAGFGAYGTGRELGYTIRRDSWGHGLATEIAAALVTWHLAHARDVVLLATAAVENRASHRVLEKVAFQREDILEHRGMPCFLYRHPGAG